MCGMRFRIAQLLLGCQAMVSVLEIGSEKVMAEHVVFVRVRDRLL